MEKMCMKSNYIFFTKCWTSQFENIFKRTSGSSLRCNGPNQFLLLLQTKVIKMSHDWSSSTGALQILALLSLWKMNNWSSKSFLPLMKTDIKATKLILFEEISVIRSVVVVISARVHLGHMSTNAQLRNCMLDAYIESTTTWGTHLTHLMQTYTVPSCTGRAWREPNMWGEEKEFPRLRGDEHIPDTHRHGLNHILLSSVRSDHANTHSLRREGEWSRWSRLNGYSPSLLACMQGVTHAHTLLDVLTCTNTQERFTNR